jgi:putative phosphoesterase
MSLNKKDIQFSLIIGDSHIPRRAKGIPSPITDAISDFIGRNGKFQMVFCTGDIVQSNEFIEFLNSAIHTQPIMIVRGNMDFYEGSTNPNELKFHFEGFEELGIGLIHGHQISPRGDTSQLIEYAKKMRVNILISGHTHADFIIEKDNVLLLNPGSCVGAWSFIASGIPTFYILGIKRGKDDLIQIKIQSYKKLGAIEKTTTSFHYQDGVFNETV